MQIETGLILLFISVLCSVSVGVFLKIVRARGVDVRQMIFMNYVVASILCCSLLKPDINKLLSSELPAVFVFLALGFLLPIIFIALSHSIQSVGIVRTDAAQRLSLVIPLLAAFLLFNQQISIGKSVGIFLAFSALLCLLWKQRDSGKDGSNNWLWPIAVFLGYGVIDVLFKQITKVGAEFSGGLLVALVLAGILMFFYLLFMRVRWEMSYLLLGILLGGLNFANIYTYISAHRTMSNNPVLVFSVMNMGVIGIGTLAGAVLFKEKLSAVNMLGLVLALGTVVVMILAG